MKLIGRSLMIVMRVVGAYMFFVKAFWVID